MSSVSNTAVVAARALLLAGALALTVSGFALAVHDEPRAGAAERYVCPMHPEVAQAEPGTCAICKMALVPRAGSETTALPRALAPTATRSPVIAARVDSWRFAPGATWLPEAFPPSLPTLPDDPPVLGAAQRRVFVDGVVAPATLDDHGEIVAALYRDELIGLSAGERGTFAPARRPRATVTVKLTADPPAPWDSSTLLVRFRVEPEAPAGGAAAESPALELEPGETGWLKLPDRERELLVVPESAVLRAAEGPYVLVQEAGGKGVVRRRLEIGRTRQGQVTVLAGLETGENVVIGNAFLLDADEHAGPAGSPAEIAR